MLPLRHSLFHQEGEAAKPGLMKQTLEKKQKYFQLLQLEQYCDSHKTEVDKWTDVRKDLFEKLAKDAERKKERHLNVPVPHLKNLKNRKGHKKKIYSWHDI